MNMSTNQEYMHDFSESCSVSTNSERNNSHDLDELNIMNNLNNRFMNFLNVVKNETNRCEQLKSSLYQQKHEFMINLEENSSRYHETLKESKKHLNELCYNLSNFLVKERHNRILMSWYANMLKFECENAKLKLKSYTNDKSSIYGNDARFKIFSSSLNELNEVEFNDEINCDPPYLCNLSNISGSQSSLTSIMSSSSSCQSSSVCSGLGMSISHHSSTPLYSSTTTATTTFSDSSSSFSLEIYLNNLNATKSQLQIDFDKKTNEIKRLKENVEILNLDLSGLNDNLDQIKIENSAMSENVNNLRKQIEFYKKFQSFKTSTPTTEPDMELFNTELERIKQDIRFEFEVFSDQQMTEYDKYLANECMYELESLEFQYNQQADLNDAESDSILCELQELNRESEENLLKYEELREINNKLNERLITLSNSLCSFGSMSKDKQDLLITNYSNQSLKRQIQTKSNEIKELKAEIATVKNEYIQKTGLNALLPAEKIEQPSFINKAKKNGIKSQSVERSTISKPRAPYYAEIEYTKSNLFAYLVIRFDILNSMNSITNLNKSSNVNCFLKIVTDSIDGHSITIENSHKILDFDLSEWTIRREIHNTVSFEFLQKNNLDMNSINPKIVVTNSSNWTSVSQLDVNSTSNTNEIGSTSFEVIEYKFPKNFKLKRRKKINLIASGGSSANLARSDSKTSISCNSIANEGYGNKNTSNKSTLSASTTSLATIPTQNSYSGSSQITKSKCACCACKIMLTQKKGDVDSLEIKEISNWGSGLLVITKFINSKNAEKLIDYKFLKHIWVNSQDKELSSVTLM